MSELPYAAAIRETKLRNRRVFICADDSSARALAEKGFVATHCVGPWDKANDELLHERHVAVIPRHNDLEPSWMVADALIDVAGTVLFLDLQKPIAQWFADGGTLEQLKELCAKSAPLQRAKPKPAAPPAPVAPAPPVDAGPVVVADPSDEPAPEEPVYQHPDPPEVPADSAPPLGYVSAEAFDAVCNDCTLAAEKIVDASRTLAPGEWLLYARRVLHRFEQRVLLEPVDDEPLAKAG